MAKYKRNTTGASAANNEKNDELEKMKEERRNSSKGSIRDKIEKFISTAQDYELRDLEDFLTNKTSNKFADKYKSICLSLESNEARNIARKMRFLDAVVDSGKSSIGDPKRGDLKTYMMGLFDVIESVQKVSVNIDEIAKEAYQKNIGPVRAIRKFEIEELIEKFEISQNQAKKIQEIAIAEKLSSFEKAHLILAEAKEAGYLTLKEYYEDLSRKAQVEAQVKKEAKLEEKEKVAVKKEATAKQTEKVA